MLAFLPRIFVGVLAMTGAWGVSKVAVAGECPGGSLDATECVRQVKIAESELGRLYLRIERYLIEAYPDAQYGGAGDTSFSQQAVTAFRDSNDAWVRYRDAECWNGALEDGMSLNYANHVAEACKLEMTRERMKQLERRLVNYSDRPRAKTSDR